MPTAWVSLRALSLAALCTTGWAIPASEIFTRQSSCPAKYNQCSDTSLPSSYCCPSSQKCLALAGNTTLICCPSGSDCSRIRPVSCDISQQNVAENPDAVIKTTALDVPLPGCGDNTCCPFGYSCTADKKCSMNANQNTLPGAVEEPSSTTSATPSSTSSTGTGTDTSTSSTTSSPLSPESSVSDEKKGPSVAVVAGASTGAAIVAIVGIVAACLMIKRKNKKKQEEHAANLKSMRSTSSFGNFISNPIVAENSTLRTDFSRLSPPRNINHNEREQASVTGDLIRDSLESSSDSDSRLPQAPAQAHDQSYDPRPRVLARQSSIAYGFGAPDTSPYMNGGAASTHTAHTGRSGDRLLAPPQTPPQQQQQRPRELSSVSINVFADPRTLTPESSSNTTRGEYSRHSHLTTFTQMMDAADLGQVARGQGYVPYDGQPSPDPRGDPRGRAYDPRERR
ncbi:hypothetical protein B0T17DRAFT_618753 [Bombardia bombarda]|uniref:Uncharacterized protein n=1 Tax=Bombardia bombarda TaxID=252184 RepID=A0AA40BYF6_9PEZI|nr:hypothetical protein B0T17DRAFT_618753 [Bombardia bombarda]